MLIILVFLAGIAQGIVLSIIIFKRKAIGNLKVAVSEDGPYLFLALDKPVEYSIANKELIALRVSIEDYDSQE